MLIYEVNLDVDLEIVKPFEKWLQKHIEDMLNLEVIESAYYFKIHESKNKFVTHYRMESLEKLTVYYQDHSEQMRSEAHELFTGQFRAHRRVLLAP